MMKAHKIYCAIRQLRYAVLAPRLPIRYASFAALRVPCSRNGGCDTLLAKPADCGSSRQSLFPYQMLLNSVSVRPRYDFPRLS
jgi:hypothetical protein